MAVYDYATRFTQLLQQKYEKELYSDALSNSHSEIKFINAQTIKLPGMSASDSRIILESQALIQAL